jgi:hypothetical protein
VNFMRTAVIRLLFCGALVAGCSDLNSTRTPADSTPGTGGSSATGGATATGGAGTSAPGTGGAVSGTGGATEPGTGGAPASGDAGAPPADTDGGPAPTPTGGGTIEALCPKCRKIFDGTTLDGWQSDPATGAFMVANGAIVSTGKVAGGQGANLWTKEDFGDFRIFFQVRHVGAGHKPCTTIFNDHPTGTSARGLHGIQFQPPLGGSWDYRANKQPSGNAWTYPMPRPMFDVTKWHRCEVLVKASGEFHAACCQIEGMDSCKGVKVLDFMDASFAKKGPFNIMMHNGGLHDEYKDLWVETDPQSNELLSTK